MKAMILAAGLGKRLRPLTLERAKPAAPFMRRPIILRLIKGLTKAGASSFRVNLHYLPDTIEEVFDGTNIPVSFSFEPEILGTAGGLKNNESFFHNEPFFMVNGDIVTTLDLGPLIEFHWRERPLATLALLEQKSPYKHFPVRIDDSCNLYNFKGLESDSSPDPRVFAFTGAHIIDPEIFDFIPRHSPYDINSQAYLAAIRAGKRVCGVPVTGYWNDLGEPGRYLFAHFQAQAPGSGFSREEPISPSARIDPCSNIDPFSIVDDNCRIGPNVELRNCVLWKDVEITDSVRLTNCIVGSSVRINRSHNNRIITNNGCSDFNLGPE
jgi:mannose-1-phosphate guanylyltransferase/mannose-1-phosphate guanylyltransferase/phosphomannomutase